MSARIEIIVAAVDKVTNEMMRMSGATTAAIGKQTTALEKLNKTSGMIWKASAIGIAAYPMINFLKSSVQAAMEAEDAEAKLTAAIGHRSQVLIDNAKILQAKSIYDDEAIMNAQALLGMFIKEESAIKKLMPAVLNLAAAKGIDLASAAELVRKGMTGTTTALSRYGINLEGAAGTTKRMESVTRELNAAFGAQADALAETTSGKIKKFQNQMGELKESIGGPVLVTLGKLADKLVEIKNGMDAVGKDVLARLFGQTPSESIAEEYVKIDKMIQAAEKSGKKLTDMVTGENVNKGIKIVKGKFVQDIQFETKSLQDLINRREELVRQTKALKREEENTVTLKVDTKDTTTKTAKEEYGTSPFSMTKTAAAMSRSLALKQQLVLDSKFLREAGVTEIEITKSTEAIKTLVAKQAADERIRIAKQEQEAQWDMHANTANALMNLSMAMLSANRKDAKKNQGILIAMAVAQAAGAAVSGVYKAVSGSKNAYEAAIKAIGIVAEIAAITIPQIAAIKSQSFATGTMFAPGGVARVHQDETIYLPRGSRVRTARESAQSSTMNFNFNAPISRETWPDVKRELRYLGNQLKQGIRGGQIKPSQIGLVAA